MVRLIVAAEHYSRRLAAPVAVLGLFGLVAHADTELELACRRALGERSGAIVVVDIASGREIANFSSGKLAGRYPAGSVAKLACAHAGLLSGALSESTRFVCRGAIDIGGKRYHCTVPGGHGSISMKQAISKSCNIWFYQASRVVTASSTLRSWRMMGVRDAKTSASAADAAVGRGGPLVTASEMAAVARTIAIARKRHGSPCLALSEAMRSAATSGTASVLGKRGFDCAVKTGSPEHVNDSGKRHGWLIGFTPAEHPKYAFAVFCLEGNAYRSAVPVAEGLLGEFR